MRPKLKIVLALGIASLALVVASPLPGGHAAASVQAVRLARTMPPPPPDPNPKPKPKHDAPVPFGDTRPDASA